MLMRATKERREKAAATRTRLELLPDCSAKREALEALTAAEEALTAAEGAKEAAWRAYIQNDGGGDEGKKSGLALERLLAARKALDTELATVEHRAELGMLAGNPPKKETTPDDRL